jgi:ribulose 1,5-bisphosphate synthetase/thiazole synthase
MIENHNTHPPLRASLKLQRHWVMDLIIIGSGPGGHLSAILTAQKGLSVTLIEAALNISNDAIHMMKG